MRSDLLDVVAVYANPIRWASRVAVHRQFEQHMIESGVRLTTVECAYGDRPFELPDTPGIFRRRVRSKSLVWNKENLMNIGVAWLPEDWQYVGLLDADITFRKEGWAAEAVHALQQYHVIQPWSHCYDLGPNDDHLQAHDGFAKLWWHGHPVAKEGENWWTWEGGQYRYAHSGFAWCYTRQAFNWLGGLLETAALGAGDHHMALALIGKAKWSLPGFVSDAYRRHIMTWQDRALHHINFNIGFLPGTVEHSWHGPKGKRAYVDRWQIIKRHGFDPDTDLKKNSYGVIELTGNKPEFSHEVDQYFRQRNEDSNAID